MVVRLYITVSVDEKEQVIYYEIGKKVFKYNDKKYNIDFTELEKQLTKLLMRYIYQYIYFAMKRLERVGGEITLSDVAKISNCYIWLEDDTYRCRVGYID